MFEKFKAYYNKENFDYSTGDINPYQFHYTFYFFCKAYQVLDQEAIPKWTYFVKGAMATMTVMSDILALISLCAGISNLDIQHITEAGTYLIVLSYKLLIMSVTETNTSDFHSFLCTLRNDFKYICSEGSKYRDRYFEVQLGTWKVCQWSIFFTSFIPVAMFVFSTIFILYFVTANPNAQRPLLFPLWMWNIDFTATPLYELFFFYAMLSIFAFAYNYIFMLQTQIVWIRQITTKCDMVTWYIQDLFEDIRPAYNNEENQYNNNLIKNRMKKIIKEHQSMYRYADKKLDRWKRILKFRLHVPILLEDYANVYKKLLLYEQKLCAPLVCMTAYCSAEKMETGEVNLILMLLCIAVIVQVFIPSYLCTFLASKVSSLCDACWHSKFWNASSIVRPYMVLMMQRSIRPLPLQAPGFETVSIETFSKKMSSAYSFFNMLRQLDI